MEEGAAQNHGSRNRGQSFKFVEGSDPSRKSGFNLTSKGKPDEDNELRPRNLSEDAEVCTMVR
jgi:hypothetical protein